jgi:hypothetical protein
MRVFRERIWRLEANIEDYLTELEAGDREESGDIVKGLERGGERQRRSSPIASVIRRVITISVVRLTMYAFDVALQPKAN